MKNGVYAIYLGKEYTSGLNKDGKIILRSSDIGDINNGFMECEPFSFKGLKKNIVCVKYVNRDEVEEYYRLRTKAIYTGYEFEIVEEKDDLVSIVAMTGDYRVWEKMGMHCIDKGVYQKWINKKEAEIKVEKEAL